MSWDEKQCYSSLLGVSNLDLPTFRTVVLIRQNGLALIQRTRSEVITLLFLQFWVNNIRAGLILFAQSLFLMHEHTDTWRLHCRHPSDVPVRSCAACFKVCQLKSKFMFYCSHRTSSVTSWWHYPMPLHFVAIELFSIVFLGGHLAMLHSTHPHSKYSISSPKY